jgi:hypothetical protein
MARKSKSELLAAQSIQLVTSLVTSEVFELSSETRSILIMVFDSILRLQATENYHETMDKIRKLLVIEGG